MANQAEAEIDIDMVLHRLHLPRELAGKPEIVRIEKGDEVAARGGEPRIARRGQARIGLTQHPHGGIASGDGRRTVGGSVINHDHIESSAVLQKDRIDRRSKEWLAVENGKDAGNEMSRRCAHGLRVPMRASDALLRHQGRIHGELLGHIVVFHQFRRRVR